MEGSKTPVDVDMEAVEVEGDERGGSSRTTPKGGPAKAGLERSTGVVRARVLNRNVAVVSSWRLCRDVLAATTTTTTVTTSATRDGGGDYGQGMMPSSSSSSSISPALPTTSDGAQHQTSRSSLFAARPAYKELMADFFPLPNILLEDFEEHERQRGRWEGHLEGFAEEVKEGVRGIVGEFVRTRWMRTPMPTPTQDDDNGSGCVINVYETMKDLAWRVLLGMFLQLAPEDERFAKVEELQETLLRGQFSLFPVALNTGFWRSPRSKGLEARRKLQGLLKSHVQAQDAGCPLLRQGKVSKDDIASHAILFTSSIAAKALASLLTASFLNLFLMQGETSLVERIRSEGEENGKILLRSILLETERLSPPVVGIMRRVQEDVILSTPQGQPDILVPSGWDVWLYFVGAGRDKDVYHLPDTFVPERFISPEETSEGFAFGSGSKACLGKYINRMIVSTVMETIMEANLRFEGTVEAEGVRGWLGWESGVGAEAFARDLKQLPCQRPKDPINVRVFHRQDEDRSSHQA